MFDTLTLDDLYALHTRLCAEHKGRHEQLMALSIYSDEYTVLDAKQRETNEAANAVFAEITRRDTANADILRRA